MNFFCAYSVKIPFHINKALKGRTKPVEIIDALINNKRYFLFDVGYPIQKLPFVLTTNYMNQIIDNSKNDVKSDFKYKLSKSAEVKQYGNFYLSYKDYILLQNSHINTTMNFLLREEKEPYNYTGIFGLQLVEKKSDDKFNFFFQLKQLNIINKVLFYFTYREREAGYITIGMDAYDDEPEMYSEKNTLTIDVDRLLDYEVHINHKFKYPWNLNFSEIYYEKNIPKNSEMNPHVEISRKHTRRVNFFQAILVPEDELIKAPYEYQEAIERDFFDPLNKDNICKKLTFEGKYFFVCQRENEKILRKLFPTIFFYHEKLNYKFELNFDDLFIKVHKYFVFGIYFECSPIEIFPGAFLSEWYFGNIFLRKYCFGFDMENNKIKFYKK